MSNKSLNMVRLQLDVESMRHSVVHALIDHQGEIQKQVEAKITDLVTNGHLEHKIKESVRRHLDTAISDAVKHAMSSWTRESPTVKQAISDRRGIASTSARSSTNSPAQITASTRASAAASDCSHSVMTS